MKKLELYTDGACSGNPGPGGYAAILLFEGNEKIISGGEKESTNNRMELMAVIEGLKALNEPCEIELFTDSRYVQQAIALGWIDDWEKRGWKRKSGSLQNPELWRELSALLKKHRLTAHWVEGHAGNEHNERADRIAVSERDKASGKAAKESAPEARAETDPRKEAAAIDFEIKELKARLEELEAERERLKNREDGERG